MRGVLVGDLEYAVAALLAQPPDIWNQIAAEMITQAHTADCTRKKTGRAHPQFGTGSLMSAAAKRDRARRADRCDSPYCEALACLLRALDAWRADPSRGCRTNSAALSGLRPDGRDQDHRRNRCNNRIPRHPSAPKQP